MRYLSYRTLIGLTASIVLASGLMLPYQAFAEEHFKKLFSSGQHCEKCPQGGTDHAKGDPDRKGHKIIKKSSDKSSPKKNPPKLGKK